MERVFTTRNVRFKTWPRFSVQGGAVKNVDAALAGALFRFCLGSPQLKERTLRIAFGGFFTVSQGL